MNILKKGSELTLSDLIKFPVWEFAFKESKAHGLDTVSLKPNSGSPPYDIHVTRFLIRTSFRLANGTLFTGHTKPFDLLDHSIGHLPPVDLFPVIVTSKGHVIFSYGIFKPDEKELAKNYRLLKQNPSDVFPIEFMLDVEIVNGISNGIINGFMYCEENEVRDYIHIRESEIHIIR